MKARWALFSLLGVLGVGFWSSGEAYYPSTPISEYWRRVTRQVPQRPSIFRRGQATPASLQASTSSSSEEEKDFSAVKRPALLRGADRRAYLRQKIRERLSRVSSFFGGRSEASNPTQTSTSSPTPPASYRRSYTSPGFRQTSGVSRSGAIESLLSAPSEVRAHLQPIRQRQSVQVVDNTVIPLFRMGLFHQKLDRRLDFIEPVVVRKMRFEVVSSGQGVAEDLRQFQLNMSSVGMGGGNNFNFQKDGSVNLNFLGARLAVGETLSFDVGLRVENGDLVPHFPSILSVRLVSIQVQTEQGLQDVPVRLTGDTISDEILFDPVPSQGSSGSVFQGTSRRIEGRTMGAGESDFVLALNFEAHFDDMLIEELVLENTVTGSDIDSIIDRVEAVDLDTGEILEVRSAGFTRGETRFDFRPPIVVPRNRQRRIGFKVKIEDTIRVNSQNTSFRLNVDPSRVEARGLGSGKDVPDSNKNFFVDADTFFIAGSVASLHPSSTQPSSLAVTGNPEQAYRFVVTNGGNKTISLARVSFDVRLGGLNFAGGSASADDFQLRRIRGFQEFNDGFSAASVSGNVVRFDNGGEVFINRGESVEYVLKVAFEESGSADDQDSVSVSVLGDSTSQVGTLSTLRGAGVNFIWSDHSGRPHNTSSNDWLSGFLFSGLPTNTVVNKR